MVNSTSKENYRKIEINMRGENNMKQNMDSRKYLESYFKDEVLSAKDIQDRILLVMKEDDLMEKREDGTAMYLKKRPLIKYLKVALKDIKPTAVIRQLNNLLKEGVLKISTKYKTMPFVIKGRLYDSRWSTVDDYRKRNLGSMLTTILMGDDPQKRLRYINDALANGAKPKLDI
jgi:hypothetical protein